MSNHLPKKTSLKTKLAAALSVVNALNAAAAVALPYVNMTPNVVADGAKVEKLIDGVAGAMYGTAHAEHQVINVDSGGQLDSAEFDDAVINVNNAGQTSGVTIKGTETTSGVIIDYSGGFSHITTISKGGTQIVEDGGGISQTTDAGGVLELHSGAKFTTDYADTIGEIVNKPFSNYVLNGGTLRLVDNAEITDYNITNGTLELGAGGKATSTTLSGNGATKGVEIVNGGTSLNAVVGNGGTQIVKTGTATGATINNGGVQEISGGTVTGATVNGGSQIVKAGTATDAMINNGGVQEISGGTVTGTTVNGGSQIVMNGGSASATKLTAGSTGTLYVSAGGAASEIVMAGGTVSVEDNATAQIATATGGTLKLLETGLAEAVFGGLDAGTFTVDTLTATGDTVKLGLGGNGGEAASAVGKTLNIGTLNGSAKFYVNTDLANNQSDKINITNSTKNQSTILVNYDATVAATGTAPAGAKALVATVADSNATFTGGETTVGGYTFTPTLVQEGTNWFITGAKETGSSEQMYASLSNATWQAIAWRDSNFAIGSRMAQLHHDPAAAHQNDFWVDFTRGRMRTNTFDHGVNRTYNRVSVGYDRLVGRGWTVGLAYGYEKGSEGYEKGSGESTGNVVTAYATWQGARGNYVDMTVKGGWLDSDFTVQDENQLAPSKADANTKGVGVSAVYGHRFGNANAFYVEPHAGFYWSHLGGYDYRLSDGSHVDVDGCNSFVGNLGVNIGQRLGKGEIYARADFMHDFSGNIRVSMTKAGTDNTMENPLRDNWFNVAVGYRQNYERVGWYAEAGCQSIGSRESSGDWVWKAGVEFKF